MIPALLVLFFVALVLVALPDFDGIAMTLLGITFAGVMLFSAWILA